MRHEGALPNGRWRDERKDDETVWAVTCLLVRAGFQRRAVMRIDF